MLDKCSKIKAWAEDVNVPVLALVALSKQDATRYHKSQGDAVAKFDDQGDSFRGVIGGLYAGDSTDDDLKVTLWPACRSTTMPRNL